MEEILHHLECMNFVNTEDKIPSSTGEFTGFLNHQQHYDVHPYLWKWSNLTSIVFRWVETQPPTSIAMNDSWTIHPGRLTWNLQMPHLQRKMIFQTSMVMFQVNLQACNKPPIIDSKSPHQRNLIMGIRGPNDATKPQGKGRWEKQTPQKINGWKLKSPTWISETHLPKHHFQVGCNRHHPLRVGGFLQAQISGVKLRGYPFLLP